MLPLLHMLHMPLMLPVAPLGLTAHMLLMLLMLSLGHMFLCLQKGSPRCFSFFL
jgi:hypothetical protein